MARLIIEQVRGGFFLVDGNDRSVASIDTLAVEVRCWADSLPVIQPRVLPPVAPSNIGSVEMPPLTEDQQAYLQQIRNMPPPDLNTMIGTPDTAPPPFRVGDRVVFRDRGRKILESAGPWTVDAVSPYRTVLLNVHNDLRDWWVDEGELRHAPEEV